MPTGDGGTIINGRSGTGDFTMGTSALSWACSVREFSVGSSLDVIPTTTLCNEAQPTFETGSERLNFDVSLFLRKGVAASGSLIPAPVGVALDFIYDKVGTNSCHISFTGSFTSVRATRAAGTAAVLTGSGISSGAFAVAWNTTVP